MIDDLAKAIVDGRWDDAEALIGGIDLDGTISSGLTLLDLAVEARHPAILRRLLDTGANPNAVNAVGDTPLITSCRGDFAIETGVLLEAGADPNYKRPDGWTALRYAAKDRNYAAVRILMMKGAVVADPEPWSTALDDFARTVGEEFGQ